MAVAALKRKPEPELKTYHATMLVTRAEEWCVEAESPEEATRASSRRPRVTGVTLASGCSSRSKVSRTEPASRLSCRSLDCSRTRRRRP